MTIESPTNPTQNLRLDGETTRDRGTATRRRDSQRPLRVLALVIAAASVAPILATASAGQVQAAAGHPIALGAAVTAGSLNVRSGPSAHSRIVTSLHDNTRVTVVGPQRNGYWQQVRVGRTTGYVNNHHLRAATAAHKTAAHKTAAHKTSAPKPAHVALPVVTGYASLPSARHWSRPLGVTSRGNEIAREIHEKFPQIAVMGGYRHEWGSDHNTHRAIDNMLPGNYRLPAQRALGFAVAEWARANAKRLGITYVIWDQHIWNIARDREGWRRMPNRGSDNENHKNHVHISFR